MRSRASLVWAAEKNGYEERRTSAVCDGLSAWRQNVKDDPDAEDPHLPLFCPQSELVIRLWHKHSRRPHPKASANKSDKARKQNTLEMHTTGGAEPRGGLLLTETPCPPSGPPRLRECLGVKLILTGQAKILPAARPLLFALSGKEKKQLQKKRKKGRRSQSLRELS